MSLLPKPTSKISRTTHVLPNLITHDQKILPALIYLIIMKNYSLFLLLLTALTGCGQLGPLYLPGTPPPIHVEPEPKPEAKKPLPPPAPEQKTPSETPSEPEKTK